MLLFLMYVWNSHYFQNRKLVISKAEKVRHQNMYSSVTLYSISYLALV